MVESTSLLTRRAVKGSEGSNPSVSATTSLNSVSITIQTLASFERGRDSKGAGNMSKANALPSRGREYSVFYKRSVVKYFSNL